MHVRLRLPAALVLAFASGLNAQTPTSAPASPPTRPKIGTLRSAGFGGHMAFYDELKNFVQLDGEQQQNVKALLKAADEEFRTARTEMSPGPDVTKRMAESIKEIEAARAAGDSAREKALIDERTAITRGFVEKRQKMVDKMMAIDEALKAKVAETLRPDQREKFATFWTTRNGSPDPQSVKGYDGLIRSPVALKSALDRLGDLTALQQTNIDAAFKEHQATTRAGVNPSVKEDALRRLYMRSFATLTEGQHARVKQELTPKSAPAAESTTTAPAVEPGKSEPAPKSP